MYLRRRAFTLAFVLSAVLCQSGVYGQQDCRPKRDYPDLNGHWIDDLNGEGVDITAGRDVDSQSIINVVATYSTADKSCRDPDNDGNPVPFHTDFQGAIGEYPHVVKGDIYWCDTNKDKGKTYTTGVDHGHIMLTESKDGTKLDGDFYGRNGKEHISFTRTSKLPNYSEVVLHLSAGTKIYAEPSTTSDVMWTPAAGTRVIAEEAQHDAKGNATWYFVVNFASRAVPENSGWIPASKVTCPSPPGPVGMLLFN